MQETVSASDANRDFSRILRNVRDGQTYVVTSHGRPVARIVPTQRHTRLARGARTALLSRLERQPVIDIGQWTRDELYEEEQ